MLRTFICILLVGCALAVSAQGFKPPVTGVGVIYNKETTFNLRVSTNRGLAPGMEFGKLRTYYRTTYFHISLGELRHTKEQRQSPSPSVSRSFRSFVFGKQNNLYAIRGAWGAKRYYSEKARQKGVAVGISYAAGPTLGLLKPYYLAVRQQGNNPGESRVEYEKYSDENAGVFLDNTRILGAAPFTRGITDLGVLPGVNASIAFHMDWGAFDEFVKALEIGLMVDAFVKKAPILVSPENNQVFFNFFINLQLGKRR